MLAATTNALPAAAEQPTPSQTVFVVEDDLDTREAIAELFSPQGFKVRAFGSAEEFLSGYHPAGPACLLLDERLPGMPGSELLRRLHASGVRLPTVLVTAYATTPITVAAMRHGATTVLDKPCSDSNLREAVGHALEEDTQRRRREAHCAAAKDRLATLSDSERRVLEMVLQGTPNKQIARRLGVCVRTIEARRSRIYNAAGVKSVAELVRLCVAAGFIDA
ncbi:MAG: response regulator [Planctomycetota bacterium]